MPERADAVVVGAGPAGAATALGLGRRGFDVLLLDRARFPRDKACGEGILPHGVAALRELGLYDQLLAAGAMTFRGLRYWAEDGSCAAAEFPSGRGLDEGLVLRRLRLDQILLEAARTEPHVKVLEGVRATGLLWEALPGGKQGVCGVKVVGEEGPAEIRTSLTIGADGLQSQVRRWLGAERPAPRTPRFGVRAHLRGVSAGAAEVEVFLHGAGEIYMTRCGPEEALVAVLLDRRAMGRFRGSRPEAFLEHLRGCAALRPRLLGAEPPVDMLAAGPLGVGARAPYAAGALLVGDSAGALDPITAEGISLALRGARLATEVAAEALGKGDVGAQALEEYGRRWKQEQRDFASATALVLRICRNRRLATLAIRRLARCPDLMSRLLGVSVGAFPYSSITFRDKLRLVFA